MPEPTDAQLVQRSAEGDREAYVQLVLRHRGPLAALIRRLVSGLDDAEDLLQDTLVQGWVRIGEIRNPERVQAWLLQVARNRCRTTTSRLTGACTRRIPRSWKTT